MKNPEELNELFHRFLKNECSAQEQQQVLAYLQNGQFDTLFQKALAQMIDRNMEKEPNIDPNLSAEMLTYLRQHIRQNPSEGQVSPEPAIKTASVKSMPFFGRNWLRVASVVLLAGVFVWILTLVNKPDSPTFTEKTTGAGQTKRLVLADGSVIRLNAGSRFRYPEKFSGNNRPVFLEGEAFFEVKPNPDKPFVIQTGKLKTTVLGTGFNVKAYPDGSFAEVAVLTGKVKVSDSLTVVTLLANQKAVYDQNTGKITKQTIENTRQYVAWTEGKLIFEDESLPEIIKTLNRQFDVHIVLTNEKLKKCSFNGNFEKEKIENILEIICTYIGANYQRKGREIQIEGKGC